MEAKKTQYADIATSASLPVAKRGHIVVGRQGALVAARRHHLTQDRIDSILQEAATTGKFVSPYGANRLYTSMLESVAVLGVNQKHTIGSAFSKFREIMSDPATLRNNQTAWDRFNNKTPRNENTHLNVLARYIANFEVLQRIQGNHPYGLKLLQIGCCVDLLTDDENKNQIYVQLRTGIPAGTLTRPINQIRKRKTKRESQTFVTGLTFQTATEETSNEEI